MTKDTSLPKLKKQNDNINNKSALQKAALAKAQP